MKKNEFYDKMWTNLINYFLYMSPNKIDEMTDELKKRLEAENLYGVEHPGDYYSPFWRKRLDNLLMEHGVDVVEDRKLLGNIIIKKINNEIREFNEKYDFKGIIPEDIGDIDNKRLYEITDGQCGIRPEKKTSKSEAEENSDTMPLFPEEKQLDRSFPPKSFR